MAALEVGKLESLANEISLKDFGSSIRVQELSITSEPETFPQSHRYAEQLCACLWLACLQRYLNNCQVSCSVLAAADLALPTANSKVARRYQLEPDTDSSVSLSSLTNSTLSAEESPTNTTQFTLVDGSLLCLTFGSLAANTQALLELLAANDGFALVTVVDLEARLCHSWPVSQHVQADLSTRLEKTLQVALSRYEADEKASISKLFTPTREDLDFLSEWNAASIEPHNTNLCAVVSERAREYPDAIAISDGNGTSCTYAEMQQHVLRLALILKSMGVQPESYVPFAMEKSAFAILVIYAIVRSGAACVPLDPTHPRARHVSIIERCGASLVVTDLASQNFVGGLGIPSRLLTPSLLAVCANDLDVELESNPEQTLEYPEPHWAAWVIFTSGSTGVPKGVVLEHQAICSGIRDFSPVLEIGPTSRVLQFAAFTFDVSIEEIFYTLGNGGCVCVPTEEDRVQDLGATMDRLKITWVDLTPSLTKLLDPTQLPHLKTVNVGGELLAKTVIDKWAACLTLKNTYGPAETSCNTTCNPNVMPGTSGRDIGRPVGCRVHIVNSKDPNELLPVGAVGEMLAEGPCLAREYIGDPEKSAKTFITGIQWAGPGRRFYRTGDLAQLSEDGSLQFLGRADTQVKIRGLRIELSEIEHHLNAHRGIRFAIAFIPQHGAAQGKLLTVVVPRHDFQQETVTDHFSTVEADSPAWKQVSAAREHLKEHLPLNHIPTVWAVVKSLPMTSSLKLNLVAIKNVSFLDPSGTDSNDDDGIEDALRLKQPHVKAFRTVVATVLKLSEPTISLSKSFISLGGDSLLAMQVVASYRAQGWQITVTDILRCPTLSQVSDKAKALEVQIDYAAQLAGLDMLAPFDMSPIQQSHFAMQPKGRNDFTLGFRVEVKDNSITLARLLTALSQIVEKHPMLRARAYQDPTSNWKQVVQPSAAGSYKVHWHENAGVQEAQEILEKNAASLDFICGPILAADMIIRDDPNLPRILCLTAHHLFIDLISWRVVLDDLNVALSGKPLSTDVSLSFPQWLALQKNHYEAASLSPSLKSMGVGKTDVGFWGMENRENLYEDVVIDEFLIPEDITSLILGPCNMTYSSEPVELLIAALCHSFNKVFSERSFLNLFNEDHGRDPWDPSIDITRTVGWFTTLAPVYLEECDRPDAAAFVQDAIQARLRNNACEYFSTRYLHPEGRRLFKGHEIMEVLFNYTGSFQQLEASDSILTHVRDEAGSQSFHEVQSGRRDALFEITALAERGRLQFIVESNRHMLHRDRISLWMAEIQKSLRVIATELCDREPVLCAARFPLLGTVNSELFRNMLGSVRSATGLEEPCIEDIYPVTPMQHGILLTQAQDPSLYHVQSIWELTTTDAPPLSAERISEAWKSVVAHQPTLRTIFFEAGHGQHSFYQVVLKQLEPTVQVLETSDPLSCLEQYPAATPRHWESGHRLLIAASSSRVYCRLDISHTLMDGYSMSVIESNLKSAFEGRNLSSGGFPLSYGQYVGYSLERSSGDPVSYWRQYLAGTDPCLFPTLAHRAPPEAKRRRCEAHIDFSDIHTTEFCREHGITMSTLVSTAWGLVLRAYTGKNDVCFGYLVSGRDIPVPGIEQLVGTCISMLVQRVSIEDSATLKDLLLAAQEDNLNSMQNLDCSLAEILNATESKSRALFNSIISYQRLLPDDPTAESRKLQMTEVMSLDPAEYDISLGFFEDETKLQLKLSYWDTILDGPSVESLGHTLKQAVRCLVEAPADAARTCSILSPHDKALLLENNAESPEKVFRCIHDVVGDHVGMTPDALALHSRALSLSYRQMADASDRLALHLISLGIGKANFVALCFQKSPWAVVAALATMKTGAAYGWIDFDAPADRCTAIVSKLAAVLVLGDAVTTLKFEDISPTLVVEEMSDSLCQSQALVATTELPDVSPSDTAFVLFTSGSSGEPKGAAIQHSAMASSSFAHGRAQSVRPGSRVLQFAAFTFDVATADIFTTLMSGGCVCLPTETERLNDLAQSIRDLDCNWAHLTPSVARILDPKSVPGLETLVVGGETLPEDVIASWSTRLNLVNTFGPAECSVTVACNANVTTGSTPGSIGVPVGTRLWIVDPNDDHVLLPTGCAGEILVEGWGLSSGYLGDATKTALAFVENPPWSRAEDFTETRRFYKTGDLARWNWAGELIFVGRKDSMVKLRGLKIEISQIEANMIELLPTTWVCAVDIGRASEAAVDETVIAFISDPLDSSVRQTSADQSPLALPLSAEKASLVAKLRTELAKSLPSYMIPTVYLPLTVMPMTASQKINRRQLKDIARTLSSEELALCVAQTASGQSTAPLTGGQHVLAAMWQECLSLPPGLLSPESHFFQIGGDSLTAMKLVILANKQRIPLRITSIFENPTLSALAAAYEQFLNDNVVSTKQSSAKDHTAPSLAPFQLLGLSAEAQIDLKGDLASSLDIAPTQVENAFPATPFQEAVLASASHQPGAFMLQEVIELSQDISIEKLKTAWSQVVETTPILRTRMCHSSVCPDMLLQVVVAGNFHWKAEDSDLDDYLMRDSDASMGISDALARWAVVTDSGKGSTYLVWSISHSLYDGESRSMLWRRVQAAYQDSAYTSGPSFDAFVLYHQQASRGKDSPAFWKSFLQQIDAPPFPQPPALSKKSQNVGGETFLECDVPLPSQSTVTRAALVRAAWCLLLSFYTGSDDVITGLTLTERNAPIQDIDEMFGPLVTVVPLRARPKRELTVSQYLQQLQDDLFSIMENQHLGMSNIAKLNAESGAACASIHNMLSINVANEQTSTQQNGPLSSLRRIDEGASRRFDTMPLVLDCLLSKSQLSITCRFDEDWIGGTQVDCLLRQLRDVIQALGSAGDCTRLRDIPMYSKEDALEFQATSQQILPSVKEPLPALLFKSRSLDAASECVSSWDGSLTIEQLDSMSTSLAAKLMQMGTSPGDLVPLCFERSMWMIVAQMAVWKAGAAFVPLDPTFPVGRLRNIVQQSNARVALCSPETIHVVDALALASFKVSAQSASELSRSLAEDKGHSIALPQLKPSDVAYVLFTSGSTGTPKGVVVSHGALCSSIMAHGKAMGFGTDTRMLQFCAYTFDVHLAEVWTTLVWGGTVCVPSEAMRSDIVACFNDFKVSMAMLVPTITRLFGPADVPTLTSLCLGGERLGEDTVGSWAGDVTLINGYGPTEAAILSILKRGAVDSRSIGTPVGCRAWVVDPDDHNRLSGVGMVGELLLEGPILADGYLNDLVKTATSFIVDPEWTAMLTGHPGRRLYKTGDLVQQDPQGHFNYIARKGDDTQVKLRGLRIELQEIERVAQANDHVQQAAALCPTSGPCDGKLVGVVALATSTTETGVQSKIQQLNGGSFKQELGSVHESLSRALPQYMVPEIWFVVDALPQLSSGKLDRKAVNVFVREARSLEWCINTWGSTLQDDLEEVHRDPATEQESQLLEAFRLVLKLDAPEELGISSSFVSSGGDSIAAMKLVAQCSRMGWKVTVKDILQSKNLIDLAKKLEMSSTAISKALPEVPCPQIGTPRLTLTTLQKDMIRSLKETPDSYRLQTTWEFKGSGEEPLNIDLFAQAWRAVVAQHAAFQCRLEKTAGDEVRMVPGPSNSVPIVDILPVGDGNFPSLTSPDYLNGQPLYRIAIMPRSTGEIAVRLEICHIIFDGVSWSIIMRDLHAAMQNPLERLDSVFTSFPPLRNPSLYLEGPETREYWSEYLDGLSHCGLPIAKDLTIPILQSRGSLSISLNTGLCRDYCRHASITTANLFHAAWSLVLYSFSAARLSGGLISTSRDVSFQYLVSGRMNQHGEYDADNVGCGIDLLPQRCEIRSETSIAELCRWIRDDSAGNSGQGRNSELLSYHRRHSRTDGRLWNSMINFRKFMGVEHQQNAGEEPIWESQRLCGQDPWDFPVVLQIHEEEAETEIVLEHDRTCVDEALATLIRDRLERAVGLVVSGESATAAGVTTELSSL
ncbi:hypothetical protein LQW54_011792 [Pestalotiopsis sp. IQ-011]